MPRLQLRLFLCLALLAAFALATPAQSEEESEEAAEDFGQKGAYVGVGVGFGFEMFDRSKLSVPPGEIEAGIGLQAFAGFRFHPNVSAELMVDYLPGMKYKATKQEIILLNYGVNFKGYVGRGRFQPYVLVGLGATTVDVRDVWSKTGFSPRLGLGFDYYVTQQIGLAFATSYVITTGDIEGADYVSLGLQTIFRF